MNELTDEQLMERLQQGQTVAIDELYRRYAKKLYVFCDHATRSEHAQDLVQDVFMRVIKSAHTFDPEKASFRTWAFRIARNRCIDAARRRNRIRFLSLDREPEDDQPALQETLADEEQNVVRSAARTATAQAVRDCIQALRNESQKRALLLYYLSGKVYQEIGEVLGKSTSTARNWVQAALVEVKRCLEAWGIHDSI